MTTNRKHRRALESLRRSQGPSDAQAIMARVQAAQAEVQRLSTMLQVVQQGGGLASQIPVVPVEGEVSIEDDPNFFRSAAIEDFEERLTITRMKLIGATEEFYLALAAADPADQPLVRAVPAIVRP
jgi:hypothetical protein